jgi:hypothetical protein
VGDGTNRLENSNCQNLDYARLPEKPHGCFRSNFSKKWVGLTACSVGGALLKLMKRVSQAPNLQNIYLKKHVVPF